MPARVLVVGFDAAEATLIETWAAQGDLPNFARLIGSAAGFRLGNSLETLPGAIWPELQTGIGCGRIPHYFHPRQLHTGEAMARPLTADDVDADNYYWTQASRAGLRVAALDMPQTVPASDFNGIQLFEWGLHDRNFAIASDPPALLEGIRRRFGDHPVLDCDRHGCTREGYADLLNRIKWGARLKRDLFSDLLARETWDLFSCCFSESHCVGHQFWHFQDPQHPWYAADAAAEYRHAIVDVYRLLDEALGRLIELAGPDATVFTLASHGMGHYHGGPKLLPEFLERIGLSASGESTVRRELTARHLVRHLPRSWLPALKRLSAMPRVRKTRRALGGLRKPLESRATRAAAFENNRCGAIRLNLKGREPNGSVAPGEEANALKATIRRELLALRHVTTGQPIVERVEDATDVFGPDHHPDVPDLIVVFRTGLGTLESVCSARVGELTVTNFDPGSPRSGDHTVESRLWISGAGIPAQPTLGAGNVLDLAPSVLAALGVQPRTVMDGQVLAPLQRGVHEPAALTASRVGTHAR